jgi:hypothetical protein
MRDELPSIMTEPRRCSVAISILARFADCLTNISEAGATMPERCGSCLYSSCGTGIIVRHIAWAPHAEDEVNGTKVPRRGSKSSADSIRQRSHPCLPEDANSHAVFLFWVMWGRFRPAASPMMDMKL